MTWFIFVGDLLVMLFMVCLVVWVFMVSSDKDIEETAMIPLRDEEYESDILAESTQQYSQKKQEGVSHG